MSMKFRFSLTCLTLVSCFSSACQNQFSTTPADIAIKQPGSTQNVSDETNLKLETLIPESFGTKSEGNAQAGDIIPGRWIVKFKALTEAELEQERQSAQVVLLGHIQRSENIQLVESLNTINPDLSFELLKNNPNVEFIESDSIVSISQSAPPNPPIYPINDQLMKFQYAHVNAQSQKGWALAQGGRGLGENTIIAIADTGIDGSHPDLKDKIIPGYSALLNKVENEDTHGHGTHCAGIAAATTNNSIGIAGLAPKAKLMPLRILNDNGLGTLAGVSAGITYAANHSASVISMSFGSPIRSVAIENAMNYALSKNTTLVASMGNTGNGTIMYPAAYPGVMAVGATDISDKRAAFSEYGPHISVMAPGVNIVSTIPINKYIAWNGTSMSTPAVAGVVALVKSVLPNLTPTQVKYLIEKGSDDLGTKGFDTFYGHGRINVYKTLSYAFLKANQSK